MSNYITFFTNVLVRFCQSNFFNIFIVLALGFMSLYGIVMIIISLIKFNKD